MLALLGARPRRLREGLHRAIGTLLGWSCHVAGWLVPMIGAGRLETRNVAEYEHAARFARAGGVPRLAPCLETMAEVEREHEDWFRARVAAHRLGARLARCPASPPRPGPLRAPRELPVDLAAALAHSRPGA